MLRVTVELVPFGDESKKKIINTMVIANNIQGEYEAWTSVDEWADKPPLYSKVDDHNRNSSVWGLIVKLCNNLGMQPGTDLAKHLKEKLNV